MAKYQKLEVSWKSLLFLFTTYIFISSDLFDDYVMGNVAGLTTNGNPTLCGMIVQGIFLIMLFVAFLFLEKKDLI